MENNVYFKVNDSSDHIKNELFEKVVTSKANSDILFNLLAQNPDLLGEDERFEKKIYYESNSTDPRYMGFLTTNATYFINVKFFTLALICLIFDIKFSEGLASFLLGVVGINYAAVKLDGLEKCVAYKIKKEGRVSAEQLKALNRCNFEQRRDKCGEYMENGTCDAWDEDSVQKAIDSLISKKIIKLKDNAYEIIF